MFVLALSLFLFAVLAIVPASIKYFFTPDELSAMGIQLKNPQT